MIPPSPGPAEAGLAIIRRPADLQDASCRDSVAAWRRGGACIGLVPTMGALHAGHGALMDAARRRCDRVVASIFVNPTQFGPAEDFSAYPRDEAQDAGFLASRGVDVLYAPEIDAMYPPGFATRISVGGDLTAGLCAPYRPGHFDGVATVVAKLLGQVRPDVAFFGEKDYQQLCVIRRMVRDLDLGVKVESVPTVREADGLALSSRNAYLDDRQREVAPLMYRALADARRAIAAGDRADLACAAGRAALLSGGFDSVDYFACVDAETLAPVVDRPVAPARLLAAARLGRCRLIDNIPAGPES